MEAPKVFDRLDHLTFKGNLKQRRHGWLRLTPAYSVHLVSELLDAHRQKDMVVLDPFCGTGTTALVCAERGIACDTTDINPFLLWLSQTKSRSYETNDLEIFQIASIQIVEAIQASHDMPVWIPSLHQIEKWWDESAREALGRAICKINVLMESVPGEVTDLLQIAFCRTMIEQANVSFGHQSMSFKESKNSPTLPFLRLAEDLVISSWERAVTEITTAARSPVRMGPRFFLCDARNLSARLEANRYSCVITSPPYPNRMSYIRELRPYMYWLGYLQDGRAAGELDWQAIGGTWGCATSNLTKWEPTLNGEIPFERFSGILKNIAEHSPLLSRYVHKYFCDMVAHCNDVFTVIQPGGTIHYIVGNSKFYDVLLPVESIYAALFKAAGFKDISVQAIRKRTSKKELFEFVVSARKAA